ADLRQMRHQHLELDGAAADGLLRHLDRGDIAGVTKDRPGAVADLAHHRDRHVATDERRIGACKLLWSEALQPVELGAAKDKMDRAILRLVGGAGGSGGATGRVTSSRVGGSGGGLEGVDGAAAASGVASIEVETSKCPSAARA